MMTMVLSNPRLAAIITMVSIFVLSLAVSYAIMMLTFKRIVNRRINRLTSSALSARDKKIIALEEEILENVAQIALMKAKNIRVAVMLGKAVTEIGG